MHLRFRLSLIALAASLPAMAQAQSATDFSLEPAPTPSATPQAQGPADTRSGVEIQPRAVNTPTPTPTPRPTPAPTPSAAATGNRPAPRPSATTPAARVSPLPTVTPRTVETTAAPPRPEPVPEPTETAPGSSEPALTQGTPTSLPTPAPSVTAAPADNADDGDSLPWLPIGAGLGLLALLGAGFLAWKRRQTLVVPEIERPRVAAQPADRLIPLAEAVQIRVANEKLVRSAAFATLKYRMTLINRTSSPISGLAVGIDLVSAHAGAPMEQQIATSATALEKRHEIARIAAHQSVSLTGEVQLPLAQAHVILQGRHPLLVPLMRVRVDGPGEGALLKTFVVGQGMPDGGRVQPFNLDEGPRSYQPIAQRELA